MISVSTTARRAMISSSTRRIATKLSNQCHLQHLRFHAGKQQSKLYSSPVASRNSVISIPSASKQQCLRRLKNDAGNRNNRSFSSSAPPSSKPPTSASSSSKSGGTSKKKTGTTEVVPNVLLAGVLGGFVAFVFLYSMNAVGRGDGDASEGNDPLAQLKAEAYEARDQQDQSGGGSGGRMTDDEIRALESGLVMDGEDGDRIITEVAVAAPADIAALEEEANLKIFRRQKNDGNDQKPKKKAWYRFGF